MTQTTHTNLTTGMPTGQITPQQELLLMATARATGPHAAVLEAAGQLLGLDANRRDHAGSLRAIGIRTHDGAWCARFANHVLRQAGMVEVASDLARAFADPAVSQPTNQPQSGDVVVLRRGDGVQGHVGFFVGRDPAGNLLVLGGNQAGGRVTISPYPARDLISFRDLGSFARQDAAAQPALQNATIPATDLTP